ncbi:trehalase-like domain-containing protein, partial [Streptomyces fildesensis]
MSERPINDYAVLSDCRSAALVGSDGSVDWWCLPRFDSPAVFARLLDTDAGHWSIRPCGSTEVSRRYRDGALVLETTFRTRTGTVVLVDALAVGRRERGHALGSASPGALLRQVTCSEGSVVVEVSYAPRPEFGLVHPLMSPVKGGLIARGGSHSLMLSVPIELAIEQSTARCEIMMRAGDRLDMALHAHPAWGDEPRPWSRRRIRRRLADTTNSWRSWTALHQAYRGPWQEQVEHSGRVLQAL